METTRKGNCSTGNHSTGYWSTGDCSTGHCSTGNHSTGNHSTGNHSTGNHSTGYQSTGNCSTGNHSTGYRSTGNWSTGKWSTGNCSTGDCSTGHCSTGNHSTGKWSTGNWSTGHFCTLDGFGFGAFNKQIKKSFKKSLRIWEEAPKPNCLYFYLTEWVSNKDMTDFEKIENPSYLETGGFLKVYDYKQAFSKSVLNATKEDRDLIRALPNFNNDIFLEISGVDLTLID
jgi:hypothetical protein